MTKVMYGGKTYSSIAAAARAIRNASKKQKSFAMLVRAIRAGELGKRVPTAKRTPSLVKRRPAKKPVTR